MHILRWVQVLITRVQDVLHLDLFRILRAMRILVPLVETCAIAAIGLTALTDESWSGRIYLLQFFPLSSPPVCITGYILDSFRMAIYRIFPWYILVPSRFHEMVTSKVTRQSKLFGTMYCLYLVHTFTSFVVCAKWTAQTAITITYLHWSDDDDDDDAVTNELHRGCSHIHTDQMMRCTNKTKTNIWTSHQSGF